MELYSLEQDMYYYNLHRKHENKWCYPKILSAKFYKIINTDLDNLRYLQCLSILRSGWHLSYFGSLETIKNKIENF